jgi:hypothetical protein
MRATKLYFTDHWPQVAGIGLFVAPMLIFMAQGQVSNLLGGPATCYTEQLPYTLLRYGTIDRSISSVACITIPLLSVVLVFITLAKDPGRWMLKLIVSIGLALFTGYIALLLWFVSGLDSLHEVNSIQVDQKRYITALCYKNVDSAIYKLYECDVTGDQCLQIMQDSCQLGLLCEPLLAVGPDEDTISILRFGEIVYTHSMR